MTLHHLPGASTDCQGRDCKIHYMIYDVGTRRTGPRYRFRYCPKVLAPRRTCHRSALLTNELHLLVDISNTAQLHLKTLYSKIRIPGDHLSLPALLKCNAISFLISELSRLSLLPSALCVRFAYVSFFGKCSSGSLIASSTASRQVDEAVTGRHSNPEHPWIALLVASSHKFLWL